MIWLFCLAFAGEVADVRRSLSGQTTINWTTLHLEIEGYGAPRGAQDFKAVERSAREIVTVKVGSTIGLVPIEKGLQLEDLLSDEKLGRAIRSRANRWEVASAVYSSSGTVTLQARVKLQDLVKPWTLSVSIDNTSTEVSVEERHTGLVVDARKCAFEPVFAPKILGAAGERLFDSSLFEEEAVSVAPVHYVSDPAHPATQIAGERPLFVLCESSTSGIVTLDQGSTRRMKDGLVGASLLHEGAVVFVVSEK